MSRCWWSLQQAPEQYAGYLTGIVNAAHADPDAVLRRPWGFAVEEIKVPVQLWHGEEDQGVPIAWAHALAERIPNCRTHYVPGVGHYLWVVCWEEILRSIVAG